MVVLTEYVAPGAGTGVGMATKRKGAEEPGLFACPAGAGAGGVPLTCRATKIRRLESADHDAPAAAAVSVGAGHGDDAMMGEELEMEQDADGEKAAVVYDPQAGAASSDGGHGIVGLWRRLLPWAAPEWVRDMLREADGQTVRALLSYGCAQEDDSANAALAVVPWSAATATATAPSTSTDQAASSMAAAETEVEEEDSEGAAAMDIEEEDNPSHHHQSTQTVGPTAGCREGSCSLYRWPPQQQHPMPLPVVGQASPAMWSW